MSNSNARKSKGRQKIEMKKITNENNLQVTFSKRRSGLFKKASELCTLCGADVAIVVFSPGEKVFSFGHPNVEAIIDRYLMRAPSQNSGTMQFIEAHRSANVRELNAQLTQVNADIEIEKNFSNELNQLHKTSQAQFWWATSIEEMNNSQVDELKLALEELKKGVTLQGCAANPHSQLFSRGSSSNNPMLVHLFPLTKPLIHQHSPMMCNPSSFNNNNMRGFGHVAGFF